MTIKVDAIRCDSLYCSLIFGSLSHPFHFWEYKRTKLKPFSSNLGWQVCDLSMCHLQTKKYLFFLVTRAKINEEFRKNANVTDLVKLDEVRFPSGFDGLLYGLCVFHKAISYELPISSSRGFECNFPLITSHVCRFMLPHIYYSSHHSLPIHFKPTPPNRSHFLSIHL